MQLYGRDGELMVLQTSLDYNSYYPLSIAVLVGADVSNFWRVTGSPTLFFHGPFGSHKSGVGDKDFAKETSKDDTA